MWFKILTFELKYRSKRPATYIYWGILFFIAFMAMSTDTVRIGGGTGLVKENAPTTIANMMVIVSAFFMMITSAIMGVGVLRDFEHNTESMLFTTPIKKFDYLFGRFLGSFIVTLFVFTGVIFGFMLGEFMPWRDAEKLLPFDAWSYFHPFIYFVVPNLIFTGILFFFTGALTRKMVVVYVQWIVLFIIYQVAVILSREVDDRSMAALLDPFAFRTIGNTIQYWTVAEQNTMKIPITGVVLWNRILWLGVGFLVAIGGYFVFSFNVVKSSIFKKKAVKETEESNTSIQVPKVSYAFNFQTYLFQIWKQSLFYAKYITRGIPFITIVFFGFFILVLNSFYIGEVFGTYTYPTTYLMVELIRGAFLLFFIIILVFYSGELIWRERDVKFNLIQDALPMPDFSSLISKFLGLVLVYVAMLLFLIGSGVIIQTFKGFFKYDLNVYFSTMFTEVFSIIILFTLLAFFVQVMVNNKFLGHAIMIVFFIAIEVLDTLGFEHGLLQFADIGLGTYSEMNGYGHFFTPFNWFDLYWFALVVFLFAVSVVFAIRGAETAMKWRWHIGKLRLGRSLLILSITSFMVFGLSGCYIYYNTNVLNTYQNSDEQEAQQAAYERTLKKYEFIAQPKITGMIVKAEIYPETRDYSIEGTYTVKNFESESIKDLHVQLAIDDDLEYKQVAFSRPTVITERYDEFKYYIHQLEEPLAPGDSIELIFEMTYETSGFKESGSNTSIVYNGTFLNNTNFPTFGYNAGNELVTDNDRKDNDLEPRDRMLKRDDPKGLAMTFFGDDAHRVDFEIIVGTSTDQIAVAPGYLQREWNENGRKYFHYKMDQQMLPFFNIVSANYEVMRDKTTIKNDTLEKEINLEIYYHQGHEYNLESMMRGMKNSFEYFSNSFSPYQYRQMRILEFPRYQNFAQSFANTVPFSEGIGFMVRVEDDDDVDVTYFVTAHELAHQWWAHQLIPANVQGSAVLTESLAQYSALMVMKDAYPQEHIKEFLKEELDRYLSGRTTEQKMEMPLALAENQAYIHYGKGANIMYALQDYISEDSVNAALRRFLQDWDSFDSNDRYPTTIDLLSYLRTVTPDSLQSVVTDFFEKIILFENKVDEATFSEAREDEFWVELKLNTKKLESDSLGNSTQVAIQDWIDVGIYAADENGDEKLVYLKKHKFSEEESTIKVKVNKKPSSAGIDPLSKLIDRNPDDNVKTLELREAS